jgi:hypothetical protein
MEPQAESHVFGSVKGSDIPSPQQIKKRSDGLSTRRKNPWV